MNSGVGNFFNLLSASILVTVLVISILLKYLDRKIVLSWVRAKTKNTRFSIVVFGFWFMVTLEFAALLAVVMVGIYNALINIAITLIICFFALAGALILRRSGGCPCFGAATIASSGVGSVAVFFICVVVTVVLNFLQSHVQVSPIEAVLGMVLLGVGFFVFGRGIASIPYRGRRTRNGIDYLLDSVKEEVGNHCVIFVFLKINCPACMVVLRYIEKISPVFCGKFRFVLSIDGLGNVEAVKLGEAFVLPDGIAALSKIARMTPSVALPDLVGYRVFSGLNPCSLAISKFINSFLTIPQETN